MSVHCNVCASRLDEDGRCDECDDMTSFMDDPVFITAYREPLVLAPDQNEMLMRLHEEQQRRGAGGTVGKKAE